ncbi:D-beta-hydroxybutyrate dehydrogenase, mitochondrial isoform X2 [Condylostylus longicornis]|uniref:D-beta-hydroxybutyrate dehydrogenase, mitochondrial isoform X2 n=1 Tax=Condylostylus longicornis TaxID=2530218 RepID=UPI00244DDA9C|nr:D-beta-hydroxybutyrate dehydrogenase, mitochondrial isoform X2 [Condylostylus longicornis]
MNLRALFSNIFFRSAPKLANNLPKKCLLISGCDSGLGFNLSLFCSKALKITVVSGCLSINSDGAKLLKREKNIIPIELDLLNPETVQNAFHTINGLVLNGYQLSAIVNNAGIMCFGEFEWQTPDIFESQINVNLLGTMKLTHKFLPLIRTQKGRIINITSHCGFHSLPSLSAYSASKSGLKSWNDALRMEMSKYGVKVINFVPGSFIMLSNITAKQCIYASIMRDKFNDEQTIFYGRYFEQYNDYLRSLSKCKAPCEIADNILYKKFQKALLSENPKTIYIHEPWRSSL